MNNDDIRLYKSYVKRSGSDASRLDLKLFEAYRKGRIDDDALSEKLYGKEGANAYHRLKNRVLTDIHKSELLHLYDERETQPYLLFALYLNYYNRNRFELASRYLQKAEKKAAAQEDLRLLDEIFSGYLKLVRELPDIQPEEVLKKMKENTELLQFKNRLEELSAIVSHRLRSSQNYAPGEIKELQNLSDLAEEGMNTWFEKGYQTLSFQILKARCQPWILKGNYTDVAQFLQQHARFISKAESKNMRMSELRIELLIYLTNSLNADKQYQDAVQQAELLKNALEDSGEVLYKKFVYFYYQALVNAYSELKEPRKALDILEDMQAREVASLNPMYEVFLWVNTAVCHFDLKEYAKAAKTLSRLYTSGFYKGLDQNLKLKIETAELIMRFERGDEEFAEIKIPRMMKEFGPKNESNRREFIVWEIILGCCKKTDFKKENLFKSLAEELQNTQGEGGQELIDYTQWLNNSKIK